jgi:predicted 3-demethylubiquinone-9 3-methyltransferase (glyoxalase superfamily)
MTQKITPFLWFDNNAEEAINFYTGIFKDAKIVNASRYPEGGPGPAGSLMSATFQLAGQQFMALNGGPQFKFNEAVSLFVDCESQEEVDYYWDRLTADGGAPGPCGWLKDKFGLSWQIIPKALGELMSDPDPAKAQRVMQAMLQMSKIDIAGLRSAYEQG